MPFDAYFASLFKMGAKTPISVFKQGIHTGDKPASVTDTRRGGQTWQLPATLHEQVKGGFCTGASLDWLRKVLQREDKKGVDHLKQSRVMRMAQTYVKNVELTKRATAPKTDPLQASAKALTERAASLLTGPTQARDLLKKDVAEWVRSNGGSYNDDGSASINGTAEILGLFRQKMAELRAVQQQLSQAMDAHNELIEQANALYAQKGKIIDEYNAASPAERRAIIWNDLAADLGSDAGKTRKFAGICPVASSGSDKYANLRDFIVPALSAPALTAGRGMLISISLNPPPGHAIAVHRDSTGAMFLFDPNLGVYKFSDLRLLVLALAVLIDLGYVGRDDEGKITALGSDHSWQVFAKTDAFLPTSTGPAFATAEDVMRAYDGAVDIIESSAEYARDNLDSTLREAQTLHAAYTANKEKRTQDVWVSAHNEAVTAFGQARGADLAHAKSLYPRIVNDKGQVAGLTVT